MVIPDDPTRAARVANVISRAIIGVDGTVTETDWLNAAYQAINELQGLNITIHADGRSEKEIGEIAARELANAIRTRAPGEIVKGESVHVA